MLNRRTVILFRETLAEAAELAIARKFFPVIRDRERAAQGDLIVGRYSVLPYYDELARGLTLSRATLINSYREHRYVADIRQWYPDFEDVTPKTWSRVEDCPHDQPGAFVLKGSTNSRKHLWDTHMFARDRRSVWRVLDNLLNDPLVPEQGIVIRQYVPLRQLAEPGVHRLPVTNEWRVFYLNGMPLAQGYYWSEADLPAGSLPVPPPPAFVKEVGQRLVGKCPFVIGDFGETAAGYWTLIELGDAQMGGLSCIPAESLYGALQRALTPDLKQLELFQ